MWYVSDLVRGLRKLRRFRKFLAGRGDGKVGESIKGCRKSGVLR